MSDSSSLGLDGSDLTQGIPSRMIPENGVLAGHVGDHPVLLARVDGEFFGIDGACSHYSGLLHQGLRVGHTINCPLHHACFDLRTGRAMKAPALNPLNRWKVEEANGKIFVRYNIGPAAPLHRDQERDPKKIVIVGGGAAGFAAAQRLRDLGYAGELTLLSADVDAPYDRPNVSKDYLAGQAEAAWMPLKDANYYKTNRISLKTEVRVQSVNAASRQIKLQDGGILGYDALLLATGAEPNRPETPGFERSNVHILRTLRDAEEILAGAKVGKTVVVVGASFIGLEVAASLRMRGLQVNVVGSDTVPLESKLGSAIGRLVQSVHEEHGVHFCLGHKVVSFDGVQVTLDNGTVIAADFVVLGVGVRPRLELARQAGLMLDRGVLVDSCMRSSVPGIFCAGDIARYPNPAGGTPIRVEHWVLAERQGQVAAEAMLGMHGGLNEPPYFWSVHFDLTIRYVGYAEKWDRIDEIGSVAGKDAEVRFVAGGRVMAVATINRDLASLKAAQRLTGPRAVGNGAEPGRGE